MVNRFKPSREQAEVLALRCVAEIAGDSAFGPRFLALTGLDIDGLRASLGTPATLAAALDFLLGHEPTLLAVTGRLGVVPAAVVDAACVLRGEESA